MYIRFGVSSLQPPGMKKLLIIRNNPNVDEFRHLLFYNITIKKNKGELVIWISTNRCIHRIVKVFVSYFLFLLFCYTWIFQTKHILIIDKYNHSRDKMQMPSSCIKGKKKISVKNYLHPKPNNCVCHSSWQQLPLRACDPKRQYVLISTHFSLQNCFHSAKLEDL